MSDEYGRIKVDTIENSSGDTLDIANMVSTDATTSAAGYMSAADKVKLDGVEVGAEVNEVHTADLAAKADLTGGVIPTAQIPAIAITEFLGDVASEAAMLALVGQKGDWCNRTDTGLSFVITGNNPAQASSWTDLVYPAAPVTSINAQTGTVVLDHQDVGAVSASGGNITGNLTVSGSAQAGVLRVKDPAVNNDYIVMTPDGTAQAVSAAGVTRWSIDNNGAAKFVGLVDVGGLTVDSNLTPTSGTSVEHFYGTTGGVIQAFDRDNGNLEPLKVRGNTWTLDLDGSASFVSGNTEINAYGQIITTRTDSDSYPALTINGVGTTTDNVNLYGNGSATLRGALINGSATDYVGTYVGTSTGTDLYGINSNAEKWRIKGDGSAAFGSTVDSGDVDSGNGVKLWNDGYLTVRRDADGGGITLYNGGLTGSEKKVEILTNGGANFAAGSFAIASDGDITTNIRGHGHIELDSSGTFSSPKVKLFANTGSADFVGNVQVADTKIRLVNSSNNGLIRVLNSSLVDTIGLDGSDGSATFSGDATINGLTVGHGPGNVSSNTVVGETALISSSGGYNTAVGHQAIRSNTSGEDHVGVGWLCLYSNTTGQSNVAVGRTAMYGNTTGSSNVAVGRDALRLNTTGYTNVAIGRECSYSNTTGFSNIAIGYQTLYNNTTGSYNVAMGLGALANNQTGQENTAVGYVALYDSTTANKNTAFGTYALRHLTTGEQNVAVGNLSLYTNTTGSYNTALGAYALRYSTSSYSTAIGRECLFAQTTGAYNTAVGYRCMPANTTGNYNVAMGYRTMETSTTGVRNTALGYQTLYTNSSGGYNTAVGMYAAYYNTTGSGNSAYGYTALHHNTTGAYNTAIGYQSLHHNTTGHRNTALGLNAGYNTTAGAYNVALGRESLFNCTTGSGNIGIGATNSSGTTAPVFNVSTHNNRLVLGHTSIANAYVQVSWTVTSDERDKMNFAPVPYGLDFINQLKPTAYQFKVDRDTETPNGDVRFGFKAQDILALEGENPVIIDIEDPDHLKYKGEHLVPVLVNAVQELTTMVKELQTEIAALKGA